MQTTIADFIISNPANINAEILGNPGPVLARQEFEARITYDTLIEQTDPTLVYAANNSIIAWYDKDAMVGFI